MTEPKTKTKWWLAAALTPFISFGFGAVVMYATPKQQDDWLGLATAAPGLACLGVGGLLTIVFLVTSYMKNEEGTPYAFYTLLLIAYLIALASGRRR